MSPLAPFQPPSAPSKGLLKLTTSLSALDTEDDLEGRLEELKKLKKESLERSKKAGEYLKTIQDAYKKMRDLEKGKSRDRDRVGYEGGTHAKDRTTSIGSGTYTYSHSDEPKKIKVKKKRKLDGEDSGVESVGSPAPSQTSSLPNSKPIKLSIPPKHTLGQDFTIPLPPNLLPSRPPIPSAPVPGPSKPHQVSTDFSQIKQPPQQIPVHQFYVSIEQWLKPITEEDVGFLEWKGDEIDCYVVPKLGRHYLDVWADEDAQLYGHGHGQSTVTLADIYAVPPTSTWDSTTLVDADLPGETKGHGPLTERLLTALLPVDEALVAWKGVKAAEDAMEGRPGGSGSAAAKRERINVGDLEKRIRDTMLHEGLIEHVPDYTGKVDDPIATALRQAQDQLRVVSATNNARKARLAAIARDRLGYSEYVEYRDMINRNILSTYEKLKRKELNMGASTHGGEKKKDKKKKRDKGITHEKEETPGPSGDKEKEPPKPHPAALGLTPNPETYTLAPSANLMQLVRIRRQWVDQVGAVFKKRQELDEGRIYGSPSKSIYEGLDLDVRQALEKVKAEGPELSLHEVERAKRKIDKSDAAMDTN